MRPSDSEDVLERVVAANQLLQETNSRKHSIDGEIAALRGRISRLEKAVEEGLGK